MAVQRKKNNQIKFMLDDIKAEKLEKYLKDNNKTKQEVLEKFVDLLIGEK